MWDLGICVSAFPPCRAAPRRATTARATCGKVLRPQGVESHLASVALAVDDSK